MKGLKNRFQQALRQYQDSKNPEQGTDFSSRFDRIKEARRERIKAGLPRKYHTKKYRREYQEQEFLARRGEVGL